MRYELRYESYRGRHPIFVLLFDGRDECERVVSGLRDMASGEDDSVRVMADQMESRLTEDDGLWSTFLYDGEVARGLLGLLSSVSGGMMMPVGGSVDGVAKDGRCPLCSAHRGHEGTDEDFLGEVAFDESTSLDHGSTGRVVLWRDEEIESGACVTLLVDNTSSSDRLHAVNKLPSTACLPIRYCPLCGRDLSGGVLGLAGEKSS